MPAKRTITTGNVHGCLDELKELINKVEVVSNQRLFFIGDIDKGSDSVNVEVETIRDTIKKWFTISN
jgi:hypothetical protein